MKYAFIIAQILSIVSIILGLLSEAVKSKKKIYLYNGISSLFSAVKYFLLKGYTGAISCLVATVRNIVFQKYNKKVPFKVVFIYILLAVGLQCFTIKSIIDILPIFNICFFGCCLATNNEKTMKKGAFVTCIPSICYDYVYKAYVSLGYDIVSFIICSISYYFYYIKRKNKLKICAKNI